MPGKRVFALRAFLLSASILATPGARCALAQAVPLGYGDASPLRTQPVDQIIADLERYVPARMAETGVPGVSIALVRDGAVAWARGWGIANVLTRAPVDERTVFSAASNGKPLAAFAALRLVEAGTLSLDEPLRAALDARWAAPAGDGVTLRQVLTHTSGLSNYLQDRARSPRFPPGAQFAYSGVGFMYLQHVIVAIADRPFEQAMRNLVFDPLGMTSSYFAGGRPHGARLARGHITAAEALPPFAIPFIPALLLCLSVALLVVRWRTRRWRLPRAWLVAAASVAAAATGVFLWSKAGSATMPLFFVGCGSALIIGWLGVTTALARALAAVGPAAAARPAARRLLHGVVATVALVGLVRALRDVPVPLPEWFPPDGNAASSLHATAADLGRFMVELSDPRVLDPAIAGEMREARVRVDERLDWGLGIGVQRTAQGTALFHRGSNPGSKSAMAIYPEAGIGVVVLTNGSDGSALVSDVARRALGGPVYW
jgi:CubicO group peptidase (beta-lactamase class C family)